MSMADAILEPVVGQFLDGKSAALQPVQLNLDGSNVLHVRFADGSEILWPVAQIRRLRDQAFADQGVFGFEDGSPARLILPAGWLNDHLVRTCAALNPASRRGIVRQLVVVAAIAAVSVAAMVFFLVPLLADRLAERLPAKTEQALGAKAVEQARSMLSPDGQHLLPLCRNAAGARALQSIQTRMTGNVDLPYRLHLIVLDSAVANAFALPGGNLIFTRGLLQSAGSPEEVAGVMAHEIGHVVARDPTRLMLRAAGTMGVVGLALGDFSGGALMLFLVNKSISAQYSQSAEAAADNFAVARLNAAGLPSAPLADLFERLQTKTGPQSALLAHLSSHPDSKGRADSARAAGQVGAGFVPVLDAQQWADLKAICD